MQKMSASTLYQLAFNNICLNLWKSSPLLKFHAEFVHKHRKDYPDEEDEVCIEYKKDISAMLEHIETRLEQTGMVPFRLRKAIMNAVNSIDDGVCGFMFVMLSGLTRKTLNNIKFCAQHIVYSENLSIQMTETICNILLQSKFDVMIKRNFLATYCVKKSKVKNIYVQVYNQLDRNKNSNQIVLRKRKRCSQKVADSKMKDVYDFIGNMTSGKHFWEKHRRNEDPEGPNKSLLHATDMQYVGVVGPVDALKYYYERACREFEGPERDDYILDCAKYLFLVSSCDTEILAFFEENLNPETWMGLVKDEFQHIFLTYLRNWRYRDRCMPLFFQVKDTVNKETFHTIFREILVMLNYDKYDSYGVMTVTKKLWDEIPRDWKTDSETVNMVAYLALPTKFNATRFDQLPHFIKSYPVEEQEDIFANVIFQLVATSEEKHIDALIRIAQASGFKQKEGKQFLTNSRLKNLLIRDANKLTTVNYEKVTKYLCTSEVEECELKQELLQDKHFIVDFLVNIRWCSLRPFLEWALKEETRINAFKAKLLEDELVDCVYERRLIESDLYDANRIFTAEMLNINKQEITAVRNRVKNNTMVVHWFLRGSLNDSWLPLTQFFEDFSYSEEESVELIREFLYLPETIQAVYDMVLDLPNFEISMKYSAQGSELMLTWISFITDLVRPYTDVNRYKNMLLPDIDAVASECYEKVIRSDPKLGRLESAEHIIKLRLKCFALCFERRNLNFALDYNLRFPEADHMPFMLKLVTMGI